MKTVKQSYEILRPNNPEGWIAACKNIEIAGRTAYKSEDKIAEDSYKQFCKMIVDRKHEAVIEFADMTVKFITDRGISHELVRHRLCSFVQESTRYCNYSKDKFGNRLVFIEPSGLDDGEDLADWEAVCSEAEKRYLSLVNSGITPQIARSVLPNSLKTEIVVKANFREWRHIFSLRAISKAAHPDMRALMVPLYEECRKACPVIFDMGDVE